LLDFTGLEGDLAVIVLPDLTGLTIDFFCGEGAGFFAFEAMINEDMWS
jgi:hypothetical protein